RLLRLLLSGLVLGAALRGAAAGRPDAAACPGSLDCALRRRARCPPGAHACGPCLQPFQEDGQGLCVPRIRRPLGEGPPQPRLDEEIDLLAQELARKEAGHSRLPARPLPESRQRILAPAATLGFSERGQGPKLGLTSTPGAPAPTPPTSLGSPASSGPVHMSPLEPRGGRGDGLALGRSPPPGAGAPSSHFQPGPLAPGGCGEDQRSRPPPRHKEPPKEVDSASSDEENEDGDFTVYECPGLAPTGEMEVRNPLFDHASLSAPPLQ
ncbi:PREDICTED: neural proliferation differentiation and control protein 1, partial [Galeopterus variegatus]|uniref:Neural proliferation differentiation and control protein 1 n=1 Tax=Galeopterus variegatus TaxID=482537 RepID=A0ABM0R291_GALVR